MSYGWVPENALQISVRRNNYGSHTIVGRVIATNKTGAIQVFNNAAKAYEDWTVFTIPAEYGTSTNLPATAELEISVDGGAYQLLKNITMHEADGDGVVDAVRISQDGPLIVEVSNPSGGSGSVVFPSDYPLPTGQVTTLTPQTDGLTNVELRASPVGVDLTGVTDLDIRNLVLAFDSVRQTLRVSQPYSQAVTGPVTNQVIVSAGPTERIRVLRNAGHIDPSLSPDVYPIITVNLGSTVIYRDKMEAGLPWSETVCFEGALGEDMSITIDSSVTVYLNFRYEIF